MTAGEDSGIAASTPFPFVRLPPNDSRQPSLLQSVSESSSLLMNSSEHFILAPSSRETQSSVSLSLAKAQSISPPGTPSLTNIEKDSVNSQRNSRSQDLIHSLTEALESGKAPVSSSTSNHSFITPDKSSSKKFETHYYRASLGEEANNSLGPELQVTSISKTSPDSNVQPAMIDTPVVSSNGRSRNRRRTDRSSAFANLRSPPLSRVREDEVLDRSTPMPSQTTDRRRSAIVTRADDWSHWVELAVNFSGLPPNINTKDVWNIFKEEGDILTIEIFDDYNGVLNGRGRVRFSPPPLTAFWQQSPYLANVERTQEKLSLSLKLLPPKRDFFCPSAVRPMIRYPEVMILTAESLDFGFMFQPTTMMGMYRTTSGPSSPLTFRLNLLRREIEVKFNAAVGKKPVRDQKYMFTVPLPQASVIYQVSSGKNSGLLLSLETPPNFYRIYDEADTHREGDTYWTRRNALFRQTDIVPDTKKLRTVSLTLKKTKPIIDIGRWTTYHFVFDMAKSSQGLYTMVCSALKDFNIEILPLPNFNLNTDRDLSVWEHIDQPLIKEENEPRTALEDLMRETVHPLSFPVRYQLEVCISEGWLNEYNLTKDFVDKLRELGDVRAQDLLELVSYNKRRVYNPMDIFDIIITRGSASRPRIPHYCTYVRSATVTPSTIYFSTPTVETSNRVMRQYAEHADRFLRIRFMDEKFQGKLNATEGESMNEIYTRIKRALNNGITIGDRQFEYLASGNSQFREHGAYFFCPLAHLGVEDIRKWMGDFQDIKVVAKYAARLGQCFSTTRAISGSRVELVEIKDVRNGKFVFTDGVGKISRFLAQMAASEVGVTTIGEPPSVFQFRLGGAKGVLTVSNDVKMREIHIRDSQYKFHAIHAGLEIIRWSQFSAAHLNRQLIVVMSALGVPDNVFVNKLKKQLSNLALAMTDEKMALTLLQKEIDPNQMTLAIAGLILDGFQRLREPFMLSLLQLWRAWSTKYLKEKAKIVVHEGAVLLGCIDETRTLQGHYYNLQHLREHEGEEERLRCLPEIFVQLSKGIDNKPQIVLGPVILARNPSLHPGDIRVVRGVDVPSLRHLRDVVVLPQTGDRDVANMCSGGDLDGDDYLVIWDKDLLPLEWNHDPMDYTSPLPKEVDRIVTTDDITTFFVNYMKNDSLPSIAHAHLASADYLPSGVKDPKCLKLAAYHSIAVDYPKTGNPAIIERSLRPKMWPHFMEKKYKPKEQIYVSKKILGQLYDLVERVDFVPEFETPFDERILNAYSLSEETLTEATEIKAEYDAAVHRIMAQHEIRTEFEVWSTFVLSHANQSRDFKFHEEMGAIAHALKERFRTACYEKVGARDFQRMGPFVAAMYQITHEAVQSTLKEYHNAIMMGELAHKARKRMTRNMPLISFPWLFPGILGKISNGELASSHGQIDSSIAAVQGDVKKTTHRKRSCTSTKVGVDDTLQTAEGLVHRGELLRLFEHDDEPSQNGKEAAVTNPYPHSVPELPEELINIDESLEHILTESATLPTMCGDVSSGSDLLGDLVKVFDASKLQDTPYEQQRQENIEQIGEDEAREFQTIDQANGIRNGDSQENLNGDVALCEGALEEVSIQFDEKPSLLERLEILLEE